MKAEEGLPGVGSMSATDFMAACEWNHCRFYLCDGEIWIDLCSAHRSQFEQRLNIIANGEGLSELPGASVS